MFHRQASRRAAAAALAVGFAALAGQAAAVGPRVVSINLCTDQLLLALADPDQILGLSPFARDSARSFAAGEAQRFPILSGTAEEIVLLRPDLVLAGRFTKRATRELVRARGFRLVETEAVRSVAEATAQIRQVGALLGHPDRAEAAAARIEAASARARAAALTGPQLSALPLQRRGWVSGGTSLMTSLLDLVGLRNAGASFSAGQGRQVTLEAIVQGKPDLLLLSRDALKAEDQGSALLQHPALARLYPPEARLAIPEIMTVCGGPSLADAIDRLAAEIARRR